MGVTTFRLRPDIEKDFEAIARDSDRSKSWVINEAIEEYIQRRKAERARWEETLQAMQSVAQGNVVSGEAVHTWLKSWGQSNESRPPKVGE